jgi:hypothetical protein
MGMTRWFALKNNDGNILAVYRTEWNDNAIVNEQVWNKTNGGWQDTRTISDWRVNSDANIDEIDSTDAKSLLPHSALVEKGLKIDLEPAKGVVGPLEVARGLSRLAILPNPVDPTITEPEKYVESPWQTVPAPTIDPLAWDNAVVEVIEIGSLFGTDTVLKRKRVAKHIESMGQALTPFRSYPLVYEVDNKPIIIDGHHRLMSMWLLGLDKAAVWIVKE